MFHKLQSDAVLEQMPKPLCDAAVVQILDHFDTFFEVRFAACASWHFHFDEKSNHLLWVHYSQTPSKLHLLQKFQNQPKNLLDVHLVSVAALREIAAHMFLVLCSLANSKTQGQDCHVVKRG